MHPPDGHHGSARRFPARRPRGFSLMEVMLAIGILLACLTVLGEIAYVGRKTAEDVEQLTTAQLLCQAHLNSILAGAAPVASTEPTAISDAPGWAVSVEVESLGQFDLVQLRVTVARDPEFDVLQRPSRTQCTLVRWMRPSEPPAETSGGDFFDRATVDTFDMGDFFP